MTLTPLKNLHRCSVLHGSLTCEATTCDFKINVAAYGHARALQIGHAHIANPQASYVELLEYVAIGMGL